MENIVDNSEIKAYKAEVASLWLDDVRRLKREADLAYDMMLDERTMLDGLRGIDYSREPTGSGGGDPMLDAIGRLQSSIGRYSEIMSEYLDERAVAAEIIEKVSMPGRAVLAYYYLAGKPYSWIEARMAYSHGGIMKIRRAALVEIFDLMPHDRRPTIPRAI